MYWVATTIMAAADAPCQDPLVNSWVTELNDETAEARSSARLPHAEAAESSGPAPGPANINAELISGGNHAKCGLVTTQTYPAQPFAVGVSGNPLPLIRSGPGPGSGRRLPAADQLARAGGGGDAVFGDDFTRDHGGDIALCGLV